MLCRTAAQAREAVYRKFWHPQYDNAGYCAQYETSEEDFPHMLDMAPVLDWLVSRNHLHSIFDVLGAMGATSAERTLLDPTERLRLSIIEAARTQPDVGHLFERLYAVLLAVGLPDRQVDKFLSFTWSASDCFG